MSIRAAFSVLESECYMAKTRKKSKEPRDSKILSIARYVESGQLSQNRIAEILQVSKNKVSAISRVMASENIAVKDIEKMSEEERCSVFRRKDLDPPVENRKTIYTQPDYERLCKELLKPGVTKALLHEEYVEECRRSGTIPLQLTQFKVHLNEHLARKPFSEIIFHKPGEEIEVDWTGDPATWFDPDTGEQQKAWMFVGVLPFSGYGYAEVFPDMKLPNWISAHVHMFEYFGGAADVLVCDNLKTGVIKHPKNGNVVLQKDYQAMAKYYQTTIVPARVRKPDDKPTTENLVGKLETHILAKLRNYQCFSIEEYNREVRKLLDQFNRRPFQKKEGSRFSTFTEYEKKELIPLPSVPFEYFEKRTAKVQPNLCIAYEKNFYSVPFKYKDCVVDVRIYSNRLEVYSDRVLICTHSLATGKIGAYIIDRTHMPANSSNFGDWNSNRFLRWAREYGPYTYEVVDRIFTKSGAEQKYYNGVKSLLKLADRYTQQRVEKACQLALAHKQKPTYKDIKGILEAGQDLKEGARLSKETEIPREEKSYVRGAEYYAEKE